MDAVRVATGYTPLTPPVHMEAQAAHVQPAPAYRVWNLTAYAMQDGAVLSVHAYTVKVERVGDTFTAASVDGLPVSLERAAALLTWAKDTGTVRQVEACDPAPALPLGKPRASCFHRVLSRLGLGHADHSRAASAALGRPVASLATFQGRIYHPRLMI